MLRTRLCSHPAAGRHSAGSIRWPILMPVSAVVLMTGAPSAAYAQCLSTLNAATSVIGTVNTAFLPGGSAFLATAPYNGPGQQGSGVWTRAVAGTADTQSDTNFNALLTVTPPPGQGPSFQAPLPTSCRASVQQDFAGFEVGHDIAYNADWHFGVLAGYVGAKADAANGVAQTATFEAPSAGLYGAFSRGNFSADVQARLYDIQFESLGQRLDAHGYSLTGNASYRFDLPGNWSLEPSVGGIFSRTSVNQLYVGDFTAAGVPLTVPGIAAGTTAVARGTLQVQDVDSMLGRASLKLGTSLPLAGGQIVAYPFLTASVFHEFEGNVNASITTSGKFFNVTGISNFQGVGTVTASGIGTYGQFGVGSALQLANTGWLGFARFDYRTGENIQGYSVSAGLRYQLEADRARDPGMGLKARAAEDYDWTGPYAGISAGRTRGRTHWSQGGDVDPDYAGVLAGGQVGYNFQKGKFVWGIEGDAGFSNASGARPCPLSVNPIFYSCETDIDALGSLTGRFGYTWGRALFYAKGGWAFGEVAAGTSLNPVNPALGLGPASPGVKSTNWENGGTVGAGMEFALTDRWSAKAEYIHYWFPQYAFAVGQGATANATTAGDTVRIGVNYHFKP
jgi:opacity protein-like surface antigen